MKETQQVQNTDITNIITDNIISQRRNVTLINEMNRLKPIIQSMVQSKESTE